MRIANTIAFRLFLLIATVQTIILAGLTFATIRVQYSHLMENVDASAARVSDLIARSTRYSMLLNRKEDVHNIISSVGEEPGIEGIRIYNKQGAIVFATVPSDIHQVVDMNAEACVSCHGGVDLHSPPPPGHRLSRIFAKANGERVLGLITPIRNEQQCSDAACHAHPAEKTILGVLDVKMSLAQIDQRLTESRNQLIVNSAAAVLLVSMVSGGFIWLVVRRPVKKLMFGMNMVSSGDLSHRLDARSRDELGQLAASFNTMTADLARARAEITAWSTTLEQKVDEKTADLERAHQQMVKVEKMASLGNLAATVAHELNNPLEGILTFARLLIKRIKKADLPAPFVDQMREELTLVADEAQRCGNIVKNLLVFARQQGRSFQAVNVKTVVDRCSLLINHHAQMHGLSLQTTCPADLVVQCDPNQIQQALIALMVNGIEAMAPTPERSNGGTLTVEVRSSTQPHAVDILVKDTGIGINEETREHMFEPFFTTKSEGKGVGLGLAVVYGIVERHHGHIKVESTVGKGSTFIMTLPLTQPVEMEADISSLKESHHEYREYRDPRR